jgi:hypothetical protein
MRTHIHAHAQGGADCVGAMLSEIRRVLKPGGLYLCFSLHKTSEVRVCVRARAPLCVRLRALSSPSLSITCCTRTRGPHVNNPPLLQVLALLGAPERSSWWSTSVGSLPNPSWGLNDDDMDRSVVHTVAACVTADERVSLPAYPPRWTPLTS